MGVKRGQKGVPPPFAPSLPPIFFSIENEKENEKICCTFCWKSFKDSKTVFFHSSIKTEEVLFFFVHIYSYIYLYIYKKLSPEWKKFFEQKVFLFRFYILCENFSKIGPIIKKWGTKGVHRGVQIWLFSMFILIIYSFICLIHSYFQILLVCEER